MLIIGNRYGDARANCKNLSDGQAWVDKNYRAIVRRFRSGRVELAVSLINGIQFKRFSDSAAVGGVIKIHPDPVDDLSQEEADKRENERKRDNYLRSVRRSRQAVRWAVKSIGADHLLTLTYRAPMVDTDRLKGDWKRFCRLVKAGLPACGRFGRHKGLDRWKFVALPEKHDSGGYHLHVAVVGRQDINFIRRCWYVAVGGSQDDAGEATLGQVDVRGPSKRWGSKTSEWRADKLAGYMTKYLHKTFDEWKEAHAKRYWAGRSNDAPVLENLWLGAHTFAEAIIEANDVFRALCSSGRTVVWASDGWQSVWFSG